MKKYIPILLCIMINLLFSQQYKSPAGGCEIKGTVIDSLTMNPIEYTSISIFNLENQLITGGISNTLGEFHISKIRPGKYNILIEFIGYNSVIIDNILLSYQGTRVFKTGLIKLKPTSIKIETVKVFDEKPIYEFETDKMVYNASDDIVTSSGTAEDVLNKVPMITVDQDGEISLRGNSNVKILVNSRPNRSGDIDNIPAALIDKVEVITSPSAKYDPEGMAGIINIVLKKGKYEGLNGTLKAYGKINKYNNVQDMNGLTFYSNYQSEKFNIYGSGTFNNRSRYRTGYRKTLLDYNEITYKNDYGTYYDYETNVEKFINSYMIGTDYSFNNNVLNGEINLKDQIKNSDNHTNFNLPGDNYTAPYSEPYTTINGEEDYKNNFDWEGYFEILNKDEKSNREFFYSSSFENRNDYEREFYNLDTTYFNSEIISTSIDFNYKSTLNKKNKLELGYDGRFIDDSRILDFHISDTNNNNNYFSALNTYGFNRNIHGFFIEFDHKINNKLSFKPSLRIEKAIRNVTFKKGYVEGNYIDYVFAKILDLMDEENEYNFDTTSYFPNLNISYDLTDKKNIQLGISRRVNRPGGGNHGSWNIMPFPRDVYNPYNIFRGNPFLKPEFSTQFELSYKGPIPMGFYYSNIYYRDIEDGIEWYSDDSIEGANITTFINASSSYEYGLEAFMMIMGQTWGGGYNKNYIDDADEISHSGEHTHDLKGSSDRLNMYMRINLPEKYIKLFSYEFGFYYMKMKVPGGSLFGSNGTLWANTGISKSIFDKSFEISLSIDNIFNSGGFQMYKTSEVFDQQENYIGNEITDVLSTRGGRTYSLNLKYNFGKMQEEKKRNRRKQGFDGGGSMDMGY